MGWWRLNGVMAVVLWLAGCSSPSGGGEDIDAGLRVDAAVDAQWARDGSETDGALADAALQDSGMRDGIVADADLNFDAAVFCEELDKPNELIGDRRFRRGFIPLDQDTGQPEENVIMSTGLCQGEPIWSIAQWDSLGDLAQATMQTLPSGALRWENQYGRVTVGLFHTDEADLAMALWAYQEYGGQYHTPTPDRVWVHLLAEQRISPPGVTRPGCPPLSSLASLNFRLVADLLEDEPHYQNGYDPDRHAAQFLIYFTVQNLNQASGGFGDYLWFGITPYDDRYDVVPLYIQGDLGGDMGTGKLIYNLGGEPFISEKLTPDGPEALFAKDILPDIRQALLVAWERGYLQGSHVLSDYRIGGMNIGWEVPGLNDVEMLVRDLSLTYEEKPVAAVTFDFNRDGDAQGWTAHNMDDLSGPGPDAGLWILQVPGDDPYWLSPELNLEAATHPTLHIVVANDHNPAETSTLAIFWDTFGQPGFDQQRVVTVPINNGGGWQTLDIDMSAHDLWRGEIAHVRIHPVISGDGHAVGVDEIVFRP